jgi:aminopeptidase N
MVLTPALCLSQLMDGQDAFTRADTLRGSLTPQRSWWNVLRYEIEVTPDYEQKSITGRTTIRYRGHGHSTMQIDLQQPLVIDSILQAGQSLPFRRDGNTALVQVPVAGADQPESSITLYYHGKPKRANRPPWDGGWIFARDDKGRPWMSVACQGLGASVWYPCKDHQSDEPEQGASLTMVVPDSLVAVGNGRLASRISTNGLTAWRWEVRNPINSYNIIPYIGKYESFSEIYQGEEGRLDCTYWVLDYELDKAKEQFRQVAPMLQCFEYWFGPYPFYEDGYQLVQAPHLGMEHQSAVAYGNKFLNGYLGRDLSGTGWGNKWDFIIIHESGHEWFGNNITTRDIADMWVHEGFTNYSETLYTECQSGPAAAREYVQGIRKNIQNDKPIIGPYGVNQEGSGDMYYKGANLIHTIRTIMQNDSLFRQMLRGMNRQFYHQTVTTQQVEAYIQSFAGFDCTPLFNQYLRETEVPVLEWKLHNGSLQARITHCRKDFQMPVFLPASTTSGQWKTLQAHQWTTMASNLSATELEGLWNRNLYITYRQVAK